MTKSNSIPIDILKRLQHDFSDELELEQAVNIINRIREEEQQINVGWIQLSRAIILIANGDISKMKDIIDSNYDGDPRDIIMQMMDIEGSNNHYGMTEF